ncbi:MAG: YebC/PmpR family DNA-binding transcriptional regulator [Planctomycetota bacterium]
MAGHSHWAQIKRKKGANDAKRGKIFSRLAKNITVAAKHGGGDPDGNLKLRYAIDAARKVNMPKDSIENAIRKGTGVGAAAIDFAELIYGGYGPGGVAILIEIVTDNRNRTAPEIRKLFERRNGKMDDSGSTVHKFEQKGVISIARSAISEEDLMNVVLDAGAEDIVSTDPDVWEVRCDPSAYTAVRAALDEKEIEVEDASIQRIPMMEVEVNAHDAKVIMGLMEDLEDHDDVNQLFTDARFPDEME